MQKLKIYPREKEENLFLIARSEALYKQAGKGLREFLTNEFRHFQYILETQNPVKIKRGKKRFAKALDATAEDLTVSTERNPEEMETGRKNGFQQETKREKAKNQSIKVYSNPSSKKIY